MRLIWIVWERNAATISRKAWSDLSESSDMNGLSTDTAPAVRFSILIGTHRKLIALSAVWAVNRPVRFRKSGSARTSGIILRGPSPRRSP